MFDNIPDLMRAKDIQATGVMGINNARAFLRSKIPEINCIGSKRFITKDNFIRLLNEGRIRIGGEL